MVVKMTSAFSTMLFLNYGPFPFTHHDNVDESTMRMSRLSVVKSIRKTTRFNINADDAKRGF